MEFQFTEDQENFRQEIRDFLDEELRKGSFQPRCDGWMLGSSPEFSRKMSEKGWIGICWPKDCYGQGKSYMHRMVLTEEMLRYGAPVAAHWFGDRQIGPTIIRHGNDEQKQFFLPRIVSNEIRFGMGMSEPEAGSDLASLQTRAVEDGDDYIIDGQKVWTSSAHHADYIYLVVRTDPNVPKHKGISEFIVDTKSPGIEINPLIDMTGAHHYNEVFFSGVRVPKTMLIGQKNKGWYQIAEQLDYERSGIERLMTNYPLLQDLKKYARETTRQGKPLAADPLVRHKLAELEVQYEAGRLLTYQVAWVLDQGRLPNFEAAMTKILSTDFEQRLANAATQILGPYGQLRQGSKWVPSAFSESPTESYLFSPGYTIQGGTSEVLRNIVALRGLQLPSE